MATRSEDLRCSFCGKSQRQVRKLIAGLNGSYICDECTEICYEILQEEENGEEEAGGYNPGDINLLKPKQIMEHLNQYVIGQDEMHPVKLWKQQLRNDQSEHLQQPWPNGQIPTTVHHPLHYP